MNAKEKAQEFVLDCHYRICNDNGISQNDSTEFCAKHLATLMVDNIVSELSKEWGAPYLFEETTQNDWAEKRMEFWSDVKTEIESLVV